MIWADTPLGEEIAIYQKLWCRQYAKANGISESDDKARTSFYSEMYANLDTLDTKAGVIMTLNGLVFALYGIVISKSAPVTESVPITPPPVLLVVGFVFAVLAVFSSLYVVWVIWTSSRLLEDDTFQREIDRIVKTRSYRTIAHRLSICFVSFSMFIFFLYVLELMGVKILRWPCFV